MQKFLPVVKAAWKRIEADLAQYWMAIPATAATLAVLQLLFHSVCPVAIVFGVPCPGCGLTRAGFAFLSGHPMLAYEYNAAIYVWMFTILYWLFFRYLAGRKAPFMIPIICLAGCLTIGLYFYRMATGNPVEITCEGLIPLLHRLLT